MDFLIFFAVFDGFLSGQVIQTTFKELVPPALDRDYQSCIIRESAVRSLPSFSKTALVDKLVESRSRHLPHGEPEAGAPFGSSRGSTVLRRAGGDVPSPRFQSRPSAPGMPPTFTLLRSDQTGKK